MTGEVIRWVQRAWPSVAKIVSVARTDGDYTHLVKLLDQLVDYVGEDEHVAPREG